LSRIGISITKETAFRDNQQEFSNVYYYNNDPGSLPSETGAQDLLNELLNIERAFHSSVVSFVHGRLWSAGGTPGTNQMLWEQTIAVPGTATNISAMDRERAYLFQYEAGFDSRGKRVYLRKWYHTCGRFAGLTADPAPGILANTTGFNTTERSVMSNAADDILVLTSAGGNWTLCAKSGRARTSTNPGAYKYLEHRQLGDQWRG
jgi:hypothetical protein